LTLFASLGLGPARVIAICGAGGKSSLMFALAGELADAGERVLLTTTTRLALEQVCGRWPGVMAADANAIAELANPHPGPVIAYRGVDETRGKALGYAPEVVDLVAERGPFTRILVEADGSARRPLKAPADHEPVFPVRTDAVVIVAGATGLGRPLSEEIVFRSQIWSRLTGVAPGKPVTPESLAAMVAHPDGLARTAPANAHRALFINQADDGTMLALALRTLECLADGRGGRPACAVIGRLLPHPLILHEARRARAVSDRRGPP